mmetsp:Transcript_12500/g.40293  ORF Transcript_12500/g.40293 Transcript_12500/m.40293 type:complete len:269 (+) Transcript_12500:95-901(+)
MLPLFMAVATAALGFGPPCMVASIRCSRLHAARSPMIASANIRPLPDDDTPREDNNSVIGDVLREVARRQLADVSSAQLGMLVDNGAIELGDVLAEIARRQLDDIDPLDVAEAKLHTLADSSMFNARKMLDILNERLGSLHKNFTSDAELAYIQASEDTLLEEFDEHIIGAVGEIEQMRGKILQARRERRRGAAMGADEAGMSEWYIQTALSDLRAAAKAQAKARALARAAAVIERHNLAPAKRRDLAMLCGLLALAAVLPPFLCHWT